MQYSNDLRRKLVEAWNTGPETQPELADLFGVSRGWVEKVLRRWRETGDTAALVFRHGPRSRLQPARVEKLIQKHSDATLGELGRHLPVSAPTVGRWLPQLGLPRQKDTARQRTRHPSGAAVRGAWAAEASSSGPAPADLCR
jgi:transposase